MLFSKIIFARFFAIVDIQNSFTLSSESEILERSELESDMLPPTPQPR